MRGYHLPLLSGVTDTDVARTVIPIPVLIQQRLEESKSKADGQERPSHTNRAESGCPYKSRNAGSIRCGLLDDYGVVLAFPAIFLGPVEGEDDLRADWEGGGGEVEDVGVEAGVAGGSVL